ncbi:MAG: MFS transporter [Candidatus Heimdallarchaeota archaeon]
MSSWLLLTDRRLQVYCIGIFLLHVSLGALRFIFPFQIILMGGSTSLVSIGSSILAIGQLVVFLVLTSLLVSIRSRFLIAGLCTLSTASLMAFMTEPSVFVWVRLFEGMAYGLYFLALIKIAIRFATRQGEVLGGLFASVFSGLAIGQVLAGIGWQMIEVTIPMLSSLQILQIIAAIGFALSILAWGMLMPLLPSYDQKKQIFLKQKWALPHFHLNSWIKNFMFLPAVLLLALIYGIYDFAHGFYTPNLSILLNQNGFNTPSISLGYFFADLTWGLSQILAGRLIDKIGYSIPLVISLILKGFIILFYPGVTLLFLLFGVLFLAGLSEGLLEPARNKAALAFELEDQNYRHLHAHLDLGFTQGTGFVLGIHSHEHEHNLQPENIIGVFKSVGLLCFGIGSLLGSFLLEEGLSLAQVTQLGGFMLALAGLTAILFSIVQTRSKKEP